MSEQGMETTGRRTRGVVEIVFFDLGNVLLSFDPNVACENVARRFGVQDQTARRAIYESGLQSEFERGRLTGEDFAVQVRGALQRSRTQMPTSDLLDAISDMFTPIARMRELLGRVRDEGVAVGLLSNTCHAHWDWIRRQRYAATEFPFDVTILSYEIGAMKPDAVIYEAAEAACGVPLDRILFLDDRAENVAGASARDWIAEQCLGGLASWDVLRRHGVISA